MRVSDIDKLLDRAWKAAKNGRRFIPNFRGEAGLGKSQAVQQWVAKMRREYNPNFGFIDVRVALFEAPDLIGKQILIEDKNGVPRAAHAIPSFWPTEGEGLIFLEEFNRAPSGTTNGLMQFLTDGRIHDWIKPPGWIIAGATNPDSGSYDVNSSDKALENRFISFDIEYDHFQFLNYIENNNWHPNVVNFVKSGLWVYKKPSEIAQDGVYVSPRSLEMLSNLEYEDLKSDRAMHMEVSRAIFGKDLGIEYHRFQYDQAPVLAADLVENREKALNRLREHCDVNSYRGDMLGVTVDSIVENYGVLINDELLAEVAEIIPADLTMGMIRRCMSKTGKQLHQALTSFFSKYPALKERARAQLTIQKQNESK